MMTEYVRETDEKTLQAMGFESKEAALEYAQLWDKTVANG